MSNTKSSCFNRLCEDSTCTHMHAGEALFVPSPCPYGKACPNGENCRCFHSHHRHTLRNCKPDVLKRFLETCAMSISTDTSREDRMEWRNRVRTYISHGRFSLRITEIAESSSRKRRVAVKRRRSRSRSRSHSPARTSGRSRSPSRSRSRSRSASRSRSRSTSRSRERVQEESVASSSTRSSANANGMFDKTVSMMRDFTEGDLSVMYKVARSLSSETD